jgi:hypothetical protein
MIFGMPASAYTVLHVLISLIGIGAWRWIYVVCAALALYLNFSSGGSTSLSS